MAAVPNTPALDTLRRRRHSLVVVLTFVTGCADATGFLALGGALSSVIARSPADQSSRRWPAATSAATPPASPTPMSRGRWCTAVMSGGE
jgi:hypothetical protein